MVCVIDLRQTEYVTDLKTLTYISHCLLMQWIIKIQEVCLGIQSALMQSTYNLRIGSLHTVKAMELRQAALFNKCLLVTVLESYILWQTTGSLPCTIPVMWQKQRKTTNESLMCSILFSALSGERKMKFESFKSDNSHSYFKNLLRT